MAGEIGPSVFGTGCDVFAERSVKLTRGAVQSDRMLYGVTRAGVPGLRTRVLDLARAMGLPQPARDEIELRFGDALMIHAGHEGTTRKLYLEFARPPADLPNLRFLAWKVAQGRTVRSTYTRLPCATLAAYAQAFAMLPEEMATPLTALVQQAETRGALSSLMLLEVAEPGTPRRSLDLNLYDAGLSVAQALPALAPALAALGHDTLPVFTPDARLGHLSAGTDRDGAPFLTVYADAQLMRDVA